MAQKKVVSLLPRIIALIKGDRLQINKNTAALKNVQPTLTQAQLNVLGGHAFTTAEQTKLAAAITDAVLQAKGYATTTAMNTALATKQATLTQAQLNVLGGNVFTDEYRTYISGAIHGGTYLGEKGVDAGLDEGAISALLNTDYPNAKVGDHVEVIQPGAGGGDLIYTTYTAKHQTVGSQTIV